MSTGLILGIAIPATLVLMMRFRKRWLAKINIAFTNRITGMFAGWLPGFGILTHIGRKSGKVYRTPSTCSECRTDLLSLSPTVANRSG